MHFFLLFSSLLRSAGQPAWQDGADVGGGGARPLSQVPRALPAAAHPTRAGGSTQNLR